MFEFLNQSDWANSARSQFINGKTNNVQRNILASIKDYFSERGRPARSINPEYYYSGYHFMQSLDGPGKPPIDRAAWFGFVKTSWWLRNYHRGYHVELVVVYRKYKEYRFDRDHCGNLFIEGRFIEVNAHENLAGINDVNNLMAWIVNFDETWDRKTWTETLEMVRPITK